MTGTRRTAGLVLSLWLLAPCAAGAQVPRDRPTMPQAPVPTGTGVIAGRMTVTSPNGPQPVRRATVTLDSSVFRTPLVADTDTEGRFRFDQLPAAMYRLRGEKAGFVAVVADPRRVFEPVPEFEVKSGQSVTRDLPMQPGAALEGRILKDNGDPAANIIVSAVRMAYDVSGRKPTAVRQARTDDLGRFRVHTLPPGDYYVDAAPDPLDVIRQAPLGTRLSALTRAYFPGTPRIDEARLVSVAVGQTVPSIDFTATSMPMAALRARVFTEAGEPANDAAFRLQRVGGPVGEVRGGAMPRSNDVNYPAVPAADYWLMAMWSRPGGGDQFGVSRITMPSDDVLDARVTVLPAPSLSGRVEGAVIPTGLKVVAFETAFEWPGPVGEPPKVDRWAVPVAADGTFSFPALPGPRLLRFTGVANPPAISRIVIGESDVTDQSFELKGGESSVARIIASDATATLTGVVKDSAGATINRARIVVFSEDEHTWGARSRTVKAVESDATGRYEVRGLLPGRYFVAAVDFLDDNAWNDGAVLARLKDGATAVTLAAGLLTQTLVVKR